MTYSFKVKNWKTNIVTGHDISELQTFLDKFLEFFLLCEGVKGEAQSLLNACPPSKNKDHDKIVLAVRENGHLYIVVDMIRDYPEIGCWTVGYLLVCPTKQSGGVGSQFLTDLVDSLKKKGVLKLRVVVQQQNPRALKFWQRAGFRITQTITEAEQKTDVLLKEL